MRGVLVVLAMCGCLAAGYVGRTLLEKRRATGMVVATVNGDALLSADLERALARYRLDAIKSLVFQRLIEQRARQLKVSLTAAEANPNLRDIKESDVRTHVANELRAQILLKKSILSGVDESRRRDVYDSFRPELRRYRLLVVGLADKGEIPFFRADLRERVSDDDLLLKYSSDVGLRGTRNRLEDVDLQGVRDRLGYAAADALAASKAGAWTEPAPVGRTAYVVMRVDKIKDRYDELKPYIDDVLFNAEYTRFCYNLAYHAHVWSPFAPAEQVKSPVVKDDPAAGTRLPPPPTVQIATPTPTPVSATPLIPATAAPLKGLPKLTATPAAAPVGLPKPKLHNHPVHTLPKPKDE